jgi:hypothetical protein
MENNILLNNRTLFEIYDKIYIIEKILVKIMEINPL